MVKNRLAKETSPYLHQHQDNPVDWYPWGPEALSLARDTDKPILLSVGYSACHWCHVMAHESFENQDIANLMNKHFINIKVDREERPDLDVMYQSALALMGQRGGWPLTMFLTPDLKPFWGGTYFPPDARYGRPGFPEILTALSTAWSQDRDKILSSAAEIRAALTTINQAQAVTDGGTPKLDMAQIDQAAAAILSHMDMTLGSFHGTPKFPQVPLLHLLWRAGQRTHQETYFQAVNTTLERMCQGGIYDHVGGGFARYATDENWLIPHFEKMLYDNAQLISLMCAVYKKTQAPLLAARIQETIAWVFNEMTVREADDTIAFTTALDADSEGVEGLFYIWNEREIDDSLGDKAPLFKKNYDITAHGNWPEGGAGANILQRTTAYPDQPNVEQTLKTAREKLRAQRAKRPRPSHDSKIIAELNGLMIQALAEAGTTFKQPDWCRAAAQAFAFITSKMILDGQLTRTTNQPAVLDDLANMSLAALALYETTGDEMYLAQAETWVAQTDDLFWCEKDGGYWLNAHPVTDVIVRSRMATDNATPNGNGTMATVLARLYLLTGAETYRIKAQAVIDAFTNGIEAQELAHMPTLLGAYELLAHGALVVIIGTNDQSTALLHTAQSTPGSRHILMHVSGSQEVPSDHPAHGKTMQNERATAYICQAGTCTAPLTKPDDLRRAIEDL